jgi:hypothetical protein
MSLEHYCYASLVHSGPCSLPTVVGVREGGGRVWVVWGVWHSDYRTVSHYWVLLVYVALIRAVWADDGDRPLLF